MDEQDTLARKKISSDKSGARAALKRKKMYEGHLDKLRGQMDTLEAEVYSIEAANLNSETVKALQSAASAMKIIQKDITPEKLDNTLMDLERTHAIGQELEEMTSRLGQNNGIDEDELDVELENLEQEALDERIFKIGNPPVDGDHAKLPKVSEAKKTEEEDEDEALRQLQAEMAL